MKVLITGDSGFIGSHLVSKYQKKGAELFGWNQAGFHKYNGGFEKKDLTKFEEVRQVLSWILPDLIIHCAGNADVNKSVHNPMIDLQSNYVTTHNLLFAMKTLDMAKSRFIMLSSAAVYGNADTLPIVETQTLNPLSPYALHKCAAEEVCLFMNKNYGTDIKIVRIFSAFGPGLYKQIFWDMFQKAKTTGELNLWGSGKESRDYIYVDDLVEAIVLIADKAPKDIFIYNVANGEEITIYEAARCFSKYMGISEEKIHFAGKRREGDPINWKADISRLRELGYVRKVMFDEGVRRYVDWVSALE